MAPGTVNTFMGSGAVAAVGEVAVPFVRRPFRTRPVQVNKAASADVDRQGL